MSRGIHPAHPHVPAYAKRPASRYGLCVSQISSGPPCKPKGCHGCAGCSTSKPLRLSELDPTRCSVTITGYHGKHPNLADYCTTIKRTAAEQWGLRRDVGEALLEEQAMYFADSDLAAWCVT